jgi:hypothetical protein
MFFLGSYSATCGGCDTLPDVATVAKLLTDYMSDPELDTGVVFFEGLMISHMLGTVGKAQAALHKKKNVLAFLDTPLEVCIERVKARRDARGDIRPFNPRNVIVDHPRVASSRINAVKQGYTVVDVDHTNAVEVVKWHLRTLLYTGYLKDTVSTWLV